MAPFVVFDPASAVFAADKESFQAVDEVSVTLSKTLQEPGIDAALTGGHLIWATALP